MRIGTSDAEENSPQERTDCAKKNIDIYSQGTPTVSCLNEQALKGKIEG